MPATGPGSAPSGGSSGGRPPVDSLPSMPELAEPSPTVDVAVGSVAVAVVESVASAVPPPSAELPSSLHAHTSASTKSEPRRTIASSLPDLGAVGATGYG